MSERGELGRIGAKQHKNSGRNTKKGDATWDEFVIDVKEYSKSISINQEVWAKITTDAIKSGIDKSPCLMLVLGDGNRKVRLAVIEWAVLEQLVENQNGE